MVPRLDPESPPSLNHAIVLKTKPEVQRPPHIGGIQLDPCDFARFQILERVLHKAARKSRPRYSGRVSTMPIHASSCP